MIKYDGKYDGNIFLYIKNNVSFYVTGFIYLFSVIWNFSFL